MNGSRGADGEDKRQTIFEKNFDNSKTQQSINKLGEIILKYIFHIITFNDVEEFLIFWFPSLRHQKHKIL